MNPDTPKIVAAFMSAGKEAFMIDACGYLWNDWHKYADARLAESGQRAIWPDGHGVAVIEDIPKPESLPTAYCYRSPHGVTFWSLCKDSRSKHLATVTFDEDYNATVTRVTP